MLNLRVSARCMCARQKHMYVCMYACMHLSLSLSLSLALSLALCLSLSLSLSISLCLYSAFAGSDVEVSWAPVPLAQLSAPPLPPDTHTNMQECWKAIRDMNVRGAPGECS